MNKKSLMYIIIAAVLVVAGVVAALVITQSTKGSNKNDAGFYVERDRLIAEVGYDFKLPDWLIKDAASFTVADPSGAYLDIADNQIYFEKCGTYQLTYHQGKKVFKKDIFVVDTEKPKFLPMTEFDPVLWMQTYINLNEEIDLNDIYKPYDNSGIVSEVMFVVYHNGAVKQALDGGSKFVALSGYYEVYAKVTDGQGNIGTITNRLIVKN